MKIQLSKNTILQCWDFARDVYETNKDCYKRRSQNNPELIKKQIAEGKMAEFGAKIILERELGLKFSDPDLGIYPVNKKSYSADLTDEFGNKYHVKSQNLESSLRYGISWIFQKDDPLIENPDYNDFVVFCTLNKNVIDVLHVELAHRIPYEEPKLERLRENKVAVYKETLDKINKPL